MSAKIDLYLEEIVVSVSLRDVFLSCSVSVFFAPQNESLDVTNTRKQTKDQLVACREFN